LGDSGARLRKCVVYLGVGWQAKFSQFVIGRTKIKYVVGYGARNDWEGGENFDGIGKSFVTYTHF
jgi:hypothetical protein